MTRVPGDPERIAEEMDALSIHGFSAHIGLIIAGVIGVALGSRLLRPSRRTRPPDAVSSEIDDTQG